jgi:hypothetical protein
MDAINNGKDTVFTSIIRHKSLLERMFTGGVPCNVWKLVEKKASNTSTSTMVKVLNHGLKPSQ